MNNEAQTVPSAMERSRAFNQYLEHLIDYHNAMSMDDPERASQEREELYAHLEELSSEEIDWLDEVSGDLYLLHGEEVFHPSALTHSKLIKHLKDAQDANEGELMLSLLRQIRTGPKVLRAHFRANAYALMGFPRLTLMFRKYVTTHTNRPDYAVLLLNDYWRYGDKDAARNLASSLLVRGTPKMRMFSAMVLHSSVQGLPSHEAKPFVEQCLASLEGMERKGEFQNFSKRELRGFFMSLASCYVHLEDMVNARRAYDILLDDFPKDASLRELRGRFLLTVDPTSANDDFKAAVRLKTKSTLPYLMLAKNALITRQYPEARKLSKTAYSHANNDRARAQAMEFIAICNYELGRSIETVLRNFDYALELDPSNTVISQNREIVRLDNEKKTQIKSAYATETDSEQNLDDRLVLDNNLDSIVEGTTVAQSIVDYINSRPQIMESNKRDFDQNMQHQYSLAA